MNHMQEMEKHLAKYSSEIDDNQQMVNFLNLNHDRNQAKVKMHMLNIAWSGFDYLTEELKEERQHLILEKRNPSTSTERRQEISLSIQTIDEQLSLHAERSKKIIKQKSELRNKYWNEKKQYNILNDYLEALSSVEGTTNSYDSEEQSEEMNDIFSTCRSIEEMEKQEEIMKCEWFEETKHEILRKSLIMPKHKAPLNDPKNDFGYSSVYNLEIQLKYELKKEQKKYFLSKDNKTLETSMETNDVNKQYTPPRSGDRGSESKQDSLSPLNISPESNCSSGCKDSGISSDEMSPDEKKRKHPPLETLMETTYEKQDISPHSGGDDDNNDGTDSLSPSQEKKNKTLNTPMETQGDKLSGADGETVTDLRESLSLNDYHVDSKYIQNLDKEYNIKIQKALLEFWEDKFFSSLDEDLIPGLDYFKNK